MMLVTSSKPSVCKNVIANLYQKLYCNKLQNFSLFSRNEEKPVFVMLFGLGAGCICK